MLTMGRAKPWSTAQVPSRAPLSVCRAPLGKKVCARAAAPPSYLPAQAAQFCYSNADLHAYVMVRCPNGQRQLERRHRHVHVPAVHVRHTLCAAHVGVQLAPKSAINGSRCMPAGGTWRDRAGRYSRFPLIPRGPPGQVSACSDDLAACRLRARDGRWAQPRLITFCSLQTLPPSLKATLFFSFFFFASPIHPSPVSRDQFPRALPRNEAN